MIDSIVQLHIDALSQNNVENTSACADVTPLTMAEFDNTCTSPTTHIYIYDIRGYSDDPEAVHPC